MELINLNLKIRDKKDNVRSLRRKGLIPAVIYGKKMSNSPLLVDSKEFSVAFARHSTSSLINILSKEKSLEGKTAVIKEIQKDPATEAIIHIDLHEVLMDEMIEIEATVHFTGKPEGVKLGGILEPIMRHILIKGYPKDIIDTINVDVSSLKIGDIIHIKDLKLPEGIEVLADEDAPVVMVAEPTIEEVTAPAEAETAETAEAAEQPQTQPKA